MGQSPPRPACEVLLLDGRTVPADRLAGTGTGSVRATFADQRREIAAADILSIHGVAVQANSLPAASFAGGDVVRGLLVAGDAAGNHLELQSPTLGRLRLSVDRLECLLLRTDLARAADLLLPERDDEALFLKAQLGFDRIVGTVHQFGEPGIRFQPAGQPEPRWYPARDLVGLRLGGNIATPVAGKIARAELCTRTGDRVAVFDFTFAEDQLHVVLDNGVERTLPFADVACLSLLDRGAVFVSSLVPVAVAEAAHDGDVLMPWQRDADVTGAPLMASGRCYGRGFGVHSRSRLVFEVPAGVGSFAARVAFDDSAMQLPVRGDVDVFVRVDDATLFTQKGLRAGEAPRAIGPLPVRPGQKLSLEVDFGAGRDLGDRIDWLMPVFLPAGRASGGG